MDSDSSSEDISGIYFDFLARHTTDPTLVLLPSPQNSHLLSGVTDIHLPLRERDQIEQIEGEERERSEIIERWERPQRERELRRRRGGEERRTREANRQQERAEHNNEEQRVRRIQGGPTPIHNDFNGQCKHYKRLCNVSFKCCGLFFPCHLCHNESGACKIDNVKAEEATHVKCTSCGHKDEINERSQDCGSCGERFSEYFCAKCKHFNGMENKLFHCDKCGICRIHGDKLVHCDVCNVCFDKRLDPNHRCRENSAYERCPICQEDVFRGCEVLPCSHKVHKKCFQEMIDNGMQSCPFCFHPLLPWMKKQI